MQLIQSCAPKNVVLVHGRREKQQLLRSKIKKEIDFDCQVLSNGETCVIETLLKMPTEDELNIFKNEKRICRARGPPPTPIKRINIFTVHVAEEKRIVMLNVNAVEACKENFKIEQTLQFFSKLKLDDPTTSSSKLKTHDKLFLLFKEKLKDWKVTLDESSKVIVESVEMEIVVPDEKYPSQKLFSMSWKNRDDDIARYILEVLSSFS